MSRLSNYLRRQCLSLILAAVLALFAANLAMGPLGPRDLLALRSRRRALEASREQLLDRNAMLRTSVQRLNSDNRYLARLIRRELGFTRPDELVFKFADADANASR